MRRWLRNASATAGGLIQRWRPSGGSVSAAGTQPKSPPATARDGQASTKPRPKKGRRPAIGLPPQVVGEVSLAVPLVKETICPIVESLETPCPVVEPVVEDLIDRGDIGILAAAPGLGKTPLVAQLAASVAGGTPFLGLPTRQGRAALLDLESKPGGLRQLLTHQWVALDLDREAIGRSLEVFVRGNPEDPNSRELDRVLAIDVDTRWDWLGGRDSNPDYTVQSRVSYH